jgi:hypothetical protein
MSGLRAFLRSASGATAAEFAMVLPVALMIFLGTIDIGRFFWAINEGEKAVQAGARYAVATRVIPGGLNTKTYVGHVCPGGTLAVGDTICREALGTITCSRSGSSVTCTCVNDAVGGAASCTGVIGTANASAFNSIVRRMQIMDQRIGPADVRVKYTGSGIGYAGDPITDASGNPLTEISPIVTVEAVNVRIRLLSLLGVNLRLPNFRYSQTLEDGIGNVAY